MPTPSNDAQQISSPGLGLDRLTHATCPPESGVAEEWRNYRGSRVSQTGSSTLETQQVSAPLLAEHETAGQAETDVEHDAPMTMDDIDQDQTITDGSSPTSTTSDARKAEAQAPASSQEAVFRSYPMSYEFSNIRQRANHTSSFLRAGSKFEGTQQSDRQVYRVEVDVKHVDMSESFLCGYLRIEGLAQDHPTLTTYFEGEIIGPKYTFQTKHDSWGATDKTDMQHWARFPAWRPLAKQAKKPDFHYKNCAQRENIFMRWKEYFLVPDHRVREISGASFEGFYYICFNQVAGTVSGIYFHAKSEKYQQLELKHVGDKGCLAAIEFR